MKMMRFWSVVLAVLLVVGVSAAPAQAQAGYSITLGDCSITVNQFNERPDVVYVDGIGTPWPTIGTTGLRVPSVTIPVAASGTYLVEVYDYSFSDAEPIFAQLVLVICGAPPAEPLDPVAGPDDPDLVVDTTVLIVDTDGVIREGQAFARLLRPTYLGNRSIIDIPFIRAADVFVFFKGQTYKGGFYTPLRVCLRGQGQLLFASVQGRPRQFGPAVIAPNTGRSAFQCAWVSEPGTLALVTRR